MGKSKTEAGEGRTIPLNSALISALVDYSKWYTDRFGTIKGEWYVFPARIGRPQAGRNRPYDPTKPMVTLKTSWRKVKTDANVKGRFHDSRHTFITGLAESGEAGDETIRDIAGHVSKQMLHDSHIGMEAKRRAVQALVERPPVAANATLETPHTKDGTILNHRRSCQRIPQSGASELRMALFWALEVIDFFGSSGRIRTYNPSVNSRTYASK